MHVQIKILDAETRELYENHSSYHEGDLSRYLHTRRNSNYAPF